LLRHAIDAFKSGDSVETNELTPIQAKGGEGRCGMLVNIFLFNLPAIRCIFIVAVVAAAAAAAAAAASSIEQTQVKR
jgi:hypothetical protein